MLHSFPSSVAQITLNCRVRSTCCCLPSILVCIYICRISFHNRTNPSIAHPHRKIQLRDVLDLPNNPVLYGTIGKLDVIYSKLQDFLQQNNVQLDDSQRTTLDVVKKRLNDTSEEARSPVNFSDWRDLVGKRRVLIKLDIEMYVSASKSWVRYASRQATD